MFKQQRWRHVLFMTGLTFIAATTLANALIRGDKANDVSVERLSSFDVDARGSHADGASAAIEAQLTKSAEDGSAVSFVLEMRNGRETARQALTSFALYDDHGEEILPEEIDSVVREVDAGPIAALKRFPLVDGLPNGYYRAEALVASVGDANDSETTSASVYFTVDEAKVEVLEVEQWMRESDVLIGQTLAAPVRAKLPPKGEERDVP